MFSWILALALALTFWCLTAAYIWLLRRPRVETRRGVLALADMRWREFSQLVRQVMREQRGLQEMAVPLERRGAPASDFVMERDDQRCMISCKHGRAYRIGSVAVDELAANARLTGAYSSVLLTVGRVERDGLAAAQQQNVEVIDERRLWPLLKPVVPDEVWASVVETTRKEAVRHTGIAALASLALGLLAGMGYLTTHMETLPNPVAAAKLGTPAAPAPVAQVADSAKASSPAPPERPAAKATAATPVQALEDLDTTQLQRLQADLSRALTATEGLRSGVWMTRSTVAVDRSVDDETALKLICENVARFPPLHAVRIQLNPLPGTNGPVRWRQCNLP